MNINLISEWEEPEKILLVWPEELYKKEHKVEGIVEFYVTLISTLAENGVKVGVISVLKNQVSIIRSRLIESENIKVIYKSDLSKISDIWIRDFGPLFLESDDSVLSVRFRYNPSYCRTKTEKKWAVSNDSAGYQITSQRPMNIESNGKALILDGGNFIHNGSDTAIVTNRIISDNEHLFEHEIREILKEKLGIEKLHIIPSEPGDDTGHIDGLVRFLDSHTLAISQYPYKYIENKSAISEDEFKASYRVTENIDRYFEEKKFNVVRIPNAIPLNNKHNFENATGNYINFLMAGDKIFVPQYNDNSNDSRAIKAFEEGIEKYRLGITVIPVKSNATPLAEYGGVINCITLPVYGEIK